MSSKINYGIPLESWNPIEGGCTKCSPGCQNCWAASWAKRFRPDWTYTGKPNFRLNEKILEKPLKWRKPRNIFVCNLTDLFHEVMPREFHVKIINVILQTPQHKYLVLTKRPAIVKKYLAKPIDNLWLGVTVCNQQEADEKIPILLSVPAAHRWVSIEPMLGEINLNNYFPCHCKCPSTITHHTENKCEYCGHTGCSIDWVIVGGESGYKARPLHIDWVRKIRDDCESAGVPFFFKQWGEYFPKRDVQHEICNDKKGQMTEWTISSSTDTKSIGRKYWVAFDNDGKAYRMARNHKHDRILLDDKEYRQVPEGLIKPESEASDE